MYFVKLANFLLYVPGSTVHHDKLLYKCHSFGHPFYLYFLLCTTASYQCTLSIFIFNYTPQQAISAPFLSLFSTVHHSKLSVHPFYLYFLLCTTASYQCTLSIFIFNYTPQQAISAPYLYFLSAPWQAFVQVSFCWAPFVFIFYCAPQQAISVLVMCWFSTMHHGKSISLSCLKLQL